MTLKCLRLAALWSVASLGALAPVFSAPVISEFMADNRDTLIDADGDYSDWIEIANPDGEMVELGGYYLTDSPTNLTRWAFPAGTVLASGDDLVVFASGKVPGPSGELHASFQLNNGGEYLALVAPDGQTVLQQFTPAYPPQFADWSYGTGRRALASTLVPLDAPVRALVPTDAALGLDWTQPDFDDAAWLRGTNGVGYDLNPDYLPFIGLDVQAQMYNLNGSVYVRAPFVTSNVTDIVSLRLRLQYEDGVVVWLNRQEVARHNAPDPLAYNSLSLDQRTDSLAVQFVEFDLTAFRDALRDGTNVLACQGLNRTLGSSDLLVRPELLAGAQGVSTGIGYMNYPTPGQPNRSSFSDPAAQVIIAPSSRTFSGSIEVILTSINTNATIRFTTDGSDPNSNSPEYTAPLTLSATTPLRASAFLAGEGGAPVAAASYLRLAPDVQNFTSDLPIIVLENFGAGMIPDKRAHNPPASDGSGIRQVPRQPAFMGIFEPTGAEQSALTRLPDLAARIGIRARGSSSALQPSGKENYSVESWTAQNEQEIAIRPFGLPPEQDWVLHAPYNYDRALIRNAWVYDIMRQMGHYAPRTRFVEVFVHLDGGDLSMSDFSGVFVFMEKIKKDPNRVDIQEFSRDGTSGGWMLESNRMDPLPEDGSNLPPYNFHTAGPNRIKQGPYGGSSSTDQGGDDIPTGYNTFLNFVEPSGYETTPAQRDAIIAWFDGMEDALYGEDYRHPTLGFRHYLDARSFIDHFIIVNLTRNIDGLQLSTFMYRTDTLGALHLDPVWDYDRSIDSYDSRDNSITGIWGNNYLWFPRLFSDPEFEQAAIDRWQELRRGPLSTTNLQSLIDRMEGEITEPIAAANFARWNASDNTPRAGGWPAELQHLKDWLASRAEWIDSQYLTPPAMSYPGGTLTNQSEITLSAPVGTIYYTLDGSDPRLEEIPGTDAILLDQGAPAAAFIPSMEIGDGWKGGVEPFDDSAWMPGATGAGFDYPGLIGLDVSLMLGINTTVFVRVPFTVEANALDSIHSLLLNVKYEDGFAAYLNGVQVASANAPAPLRYNSFATASHPDGDAVIFEPFILTDYLDLLRAGENMLAFHLLNRTSGSTDLLLLPQLVASTGSPGGLNPNALVYSSPVILTAGQTLTTRTFASDRWSGPVRLPLRIGNDDPAVLTNSLVLTELMYHPPNQGVIDGEEFEFLELQNMGTETLDLSGVHFTNGIEFAFPNGAFIPPGEFRVLVSNPTHFGALYPGAPITGIYTNRLRNSGETVSLNSALDFPIFSLTYDDAPPWPATPDGFGHALQRVVFTGNINDPVNWVGAPPSPGQSLDRDNDGLPDWWEVANGTDPLRFDANDDADGDGMTNAQEFAAGTHPQQAESALRLRLTSGMGAVALQFNASASRSYRLEFRDGLEDGPWTGLYDLEAAPTNRTVEWMDSTSGHQRFYRLATPNEP